MTTDLPPVPPAVMEFAEQHNIKNVEKDAIFAAKKVFLNMIILMRHTVVFQIH